MNDVDRSKSKIKEALEIISAIGIPLNDLTPRRQERMALALLAVAGLKPSDKWKDAHCWESGDSWALTTREVISFWNEYYNTDISYGSYDDIRRKDLIRLVQAFLVLRSAGNPNSNTNSPIRRYAIMRDGVDVLRSYGKANWKDKVAKFISLKGSLSAKFEKEREISKIPVQIPNDVLIQLTPGKHNELQKIIIDEFLPRFAPGADILYVGDAGIKILYINKQKLVDLGFFKLAHDKLPDVIAYLPEKNWLFLIEAVHSSNPMSKERHLMLEELTAECTAPRIYVSAFNDRGTFRSWLNEISWETEVWLADSPDHMIHFNGEKFLGPYKDSQD